MVHWCVHKSIWTSCAVVYDYESDSHCPLSAPSGLWHWALASPSHSTVETSVGGCAHRCCAPSSGALHTATTSQAIVCSVGLGWLISMREQQYESHHCLLGLLGVAPTWSASEIHFLSGERLPLCIWRLLRFWIRVCSRWPPLVSGRVLSGSLLVFSRDALS